MGARAKTPEPQNPKPKGSTKCICRSTGKVDVMNSAAAEGVEVWRPGQRYWWRSHSHAVLCLCPVGDWIRERYGGEPVPFATYDPKTMILVDDWYKAFLAWEKNHFEGEPPAVAPVPSGIPEFDNSQQWLPYKESE